MAGAIRQPIDIASLEKYIQQNIPDIKVPLDVKQFGFGQSNPTYQLTDSNGNKFVMRKKPPGKLLSKTAHQVDREYRIIHALGDTDVPVPKTYGFCDDDSVVGTPFYIMEFLDGRIFEDPTIPDVSDADRREIWRDAVRTLGKFHRIDFNKVGLSTFGKHSGFYNRQLKTFATISQTQAKARDVDTNEPVGEIPHYDDVVAFFQNPKTQPQDRATLVHGDYKIDNLVYHKTEPRVIGILDWEMSTIGHPLSDLANLLHPYTMASISIPGVMDQMQKASNTFRPTEIKGLPTRAELQQLYTEVAGWDPRNEMTWGDAFGIYRGSVIMQGIAARYALRQASSAKASEYGEKMKPYGEIGWKVVQEAKKKAEKAKL